MKDMEQLPTPIKTDQPQPDISTEQATFNSLSKEVTELKKDLKEQRSENKSFIYWVIGSIVAVVAVVAVEMMLFHTRADKDALDLQNRYFEEVQNLREKNFGTELRIQKEIDSLKLLNIQNDHF